MGKIYGGSDPSLPMVGREPTCLSTSPLVWIR